MRGIGQMARESGLTVSALRFYDSAGVLVPARVDPHSNYRWYADDQVVAARLLARLRRVGMPLADICRVLAHRADRSVVDAVLQVHLTRLEDGLADARRELSAARALLDQESQMTTETHLSAAAAELRAALRAVRYAVSTDPELPMLTGVLLDVDDVVRVATTVRVADGEITVDVDGRTLRGRRLDHEFPDYRRLIRTGAEHQIDVDAARLRAEVIAAPTRTVHQEDGGAEHEVSVLTLTPDGGLSMLPGAEGMLEMGVHREFLLEALDAGGDGQLVLELDGPIAPLAIRVPDRAGDVSMLMPVRLT